jgi:tRNA G10  N-methylase Trm11
LKKSKIRTPLYKGTGKTGIPDWFYRGSIRSTVQLRSAEFFDLPADSIELIITSPPDLSETKCADWNSLFELYRAAMTRCVQCLRTDGVLCVIVTDRKWKGSIVAKHQRINAILNELDMEIFAHKILVRTHNISIYRLGFSHVLCYRRKSRRRAVGKSSGTAGEFRRDVLGPFGNHLRIARTRNQFPPEVVKVLVEAFSRRGGMVLDPFCGTGTTQRVALGLGRKTCGFETNKDLVTFWGVLDSRMGE